MRTETQTIYLFGDATIEDRCFIDKYYRRIYYSSYRLSLGGYQFQISHSGASPEIYFVFGCQQITTKNFLKEYNLFLHPAEADAIFLSNRNTPSGILKEIAGNYYISDKDRAFLVSECSIKKVPLKSKLVQTKTTLKYGSYSLTCSGISDALKRLQIIAEIAEFIETPPVTEK